MFFRRVSQFSYVFLKHYVAFTERSETHRCLSPLHTYITDIVLKVDTPNVSAVPKQICLTSKSWHRQGSTFSSPNPNAPTIPTKTPPSPPLPSLSPQQCATRPGAFSAGPVLRRIRDRFERESRATSAVARRSSPVGAVAAAAACNGRYSRRRPGRAGEGGGG